LLQDDPQRVHDRKPELDVQEISRQLDLWRGLVHAGKVHAVVQVDAPQAEIADRIRAKILEHWFRLPKANPPCQTA